MKLHQLSMFVFFILAPVVIDAALPPELYWKSMLPNTTMPKAIKDLLSAGNMGKVTNQFHDDNPNQPLFWWRRAPIDQLHDNPNQPLFWWQRAPTDQLHGLHDNPNQPLFWWRRAPIDQLHDNPNQPLFWWRRAPTDQLHDNPNQPLFWWQPAPTDQLHDNPNQIIFGWQRAPTDQLHDNPNQPLFWWQRAPTDQLHDKPNQAPTDQLHDNPNPIIFGWQRAPTDQLHDNPNQPLFWWQRAPIDQLHVNPNQAPTDQLHGNPNQPLFWWQGATANQVRDDSCKFLFFLENDLYSGKKLEMVFTKSPYSKTLITREVADTIPFSLKQLPEILKMFSVEPGSNEAKIIEGAIHHCEERPRTRGEVKHCVTSLESMVDYITSKLGKNVKAYSIEVEKETKLQTYTIAPGVKKISDEVMACHQTHYPYVVFHCHKLGGSSRAYFVPLEGSDGTRVKAIAVCHSETSDWDADHLAFRTLKIKPGTAPVCHFSPADNVVWTPHEAA